MWNKPSKEQLDRLPRLYETEEVPLPEKIIHLHFFLAGCDWYVCEFDGKDIFFGYVILNQDQDMAEWGYFSLKELMDLRDRHRLQVDNDLQWKPKKAREVEGIKTYA